MNLIHAHLSCAVFYYTKQTEIVLIFKRIRNVLQSKAHFKKTFTSLKNNINKLIFMLLFHLLSNEAVCLIITFALPSEIEPVLASNTDVFVL